VVPGTKTGVPGPEFTAHTRAGAEDDVGRNNLLGYVLRPPIAQDSSTTQGQYVDASCVL
jgi:hypothetical protein